MPKSVVIFQEFIAEYKFPNVQERRWKNVELYYKMTTKGYESEQFHFLSICPYLLLPYKDQSVKVFR